MQLCIGKIKLKLLNAIKLQLLKASVSCLNFTLRCGIDFVGVRFYTRGYFHITEVGGGGGGGAVYLGPCFKFGAIICDKVTK